MLDKIYTCVDDLMLMSSLEKEDFYKNVDLLSVDFNIKIADLGFSKILSEDQLLPNLTMCGTPLYMSP